MPAIRKNVVVSLPPDVHAAWTRDAAKAKVSLSEYVRLAVEDMRVRGDVKVVAERKIAGAQGVGNAGNLRTPTVDPAKCTARLHAGAWCRRCGAIHTRGI